MVKDNFMKDLVEFVTENPNVIEGVAATAVSKIAGISLGNLFEEFNQKRSQGKIRRDIANDPSARSAFTKIYNSINQNKLHDQEILRAAKDLYFQMLGEDQADTQKDRIRLQAIDLLLNQGLEVIDVEVFLKMYQLNLKSFNASSALEPIESNISRQWNSSKGGVCKMVAKELGFYYEPVLVSYEKLSQLKLFHSNEQSYKHYGFAINISGNMDENGFPVNCDFRLNDYGVAIAEVIVNSREDS